MQKIVIAVLLAMLVAQNLYSADMAELISQAKQHPEILKLQGKIESAKAKAKKVQVLPDPEISAGLGKSEGMSEYSLMFQQAFPYPGKLKLMGEVETQGVKMLEAELSAVTLNKIAQVKKDYYELFLVNKQMEIANQTKEYLNHIEEVANTMYATGMIPQTDILKVQTEALMQTEKLIMLSAKKEILVYRMMWANLGLPAEAEKIIVTLPSEITPTKLPDYAALQRVCLKESPMLKMVEAETVMADKELELAIKEFKPDFVSSAEVMGANSWNIRLGIMYPLYKDKKQRLGKVSAEKELAAVQKRYEQERVELLSMLKEQWLAAEALDRNITLYKTAVIPQANLTFSSALANYQTGRIDLLMLFDSLMKLLEGEMRYYELLTEYKKTIVEIERLVGGEF